MMKYYFTFDTSNEDVPVLVVFEENGFSMFGPSTRVIKTFTGKEAEDLYKLLTIKAELFMTKTEG